MAHERERPLGRYQSLRELASGGMASVHLARDEVGEAVPRLVALKRIHDHLERDAAYRELFFEEARLTSRIAHPNVCSVHEFGEDEIGPFIAMEYLSGETVASVVGALRGRPWAPEWPFRAAQLVAEAAEGLHAAHELRDPAGGFAGVVHRDVSPNNLFVTYSGELKVIDFGIARRPDMGRSSTPKLAAGKAAYAAPEQLGSRPVDRRADVWSLGVTLWELLALEPLFHRDDTCSTIGAVASHAIESPSSLKRRVPKELDAIVMRALARDPSDRFATARELGRALVASCRENVEVFDRVDTEQFMGDLFPVERWRKQAMERDALARRDTSGLLRVSARPDNARRSRQAAS